jgi:hypothetical protein
MLYNLYSQFLFWNSLWGFMLWNALSKYTRKVWGLLYFVRPSLNTLENFHRKFFTRKFLLCFFKGQIRLGCFLTWFFYFWMFSIVITTSDRFCSVIWGFLAQCNFSLPPGVRILWVSSLEQRCKVICNIRSPHLLHLLLKDVKEIMPTCSWRCKKAATIEK